MGTGPVMKLNASTIDGGGKNIKGGGWLWRC